MEPVWRLVEEEIHHDEISLSIAAFGSPALVLAA